MTGEVVPRIGRVMPARGWESFWAALAEAAEEMGAVVASQQTRGEAA